MNTYAFTLDAISWHLYLDGKIVNALFNSKGAALAAINVERARRIKQ